MASQLENGKYYYIMNAATMTCLNVYNAGPPGTKVVGATSNFFQGPSNSVWAAQSSGKFWKFLGVDTNTWMAFNTAGVGQLLTAEKDFETPNQQWLLSDPINKDFTPTMFNVQNAAEGYSIELQNGNPANAALVVSGETGDATTARQCWVFIPTNGRID